MPDQNVACPLWGTPAKLLQGSRSAGMKLDSPRAGGRYGISREAIDDYPELSLRQAALVTNWLVEQRRFGERSPRLYTETIRAILERRQLKFSEQRERFFLALASAGIRPGRELIMADDYALEVDDPLHPQKLIACMGAETYREGIAILLMFRDEGYLTFSDRRVELTAKGFNFLDGLQGGADSRQVFVAMWFADELKDVWRTGFAPGIRDAGYEPFRIDGLHHNGKIDDAIVAEIKRSRFLIADFTCGGVQTENGFQPNPRGGVYYEAGLAHGLGMQVIFTCRADRMDWLHFDTRQFAHIVWNTPTDLRTQLYNRIAATVGEAPSAPGQGRGTVDPPPREPDAHEDA